MDLFQRDSDNEGENEEFDETEVKWRKERFEREQWLREQVGWAARRACSVSVSLLDVKSFIPQVKLQY